MNDFELTVPCSHCSQESADQSLLIIKEFSSESGAVLNTCESNFQKYPNYWSTSYILPRRKDVHKL